MKRQNQPIKIRPHPASTGEVLHERHIRFPRELSNWESTRIRRASGPDRERIIAELGGVG